MQDCELYGRILGIAAPWRVERVELQLKQGEVHVYLAHDNQLEWPCAECGASCALYDHQAERQWRHLDTCQYAPFCMPHRRAVSVVSTGYAWYSCPGPRPTLALLP